MRRGSALAMFAAGLALLAIAAALLVFDFAGPEVSEVLAIFLAIVGLFMSAEGGIALRRRRLESRGPPPRRP